MTKQITVYLPDNSTLKEEIATLKANNELSYYNRSESAIALMLLNERIGQILNGEKNE